jgi:glutaredoxin
MATTDARAAGQGRSNTWRAMVMARQAPWAHNVPVRCAPHSLACGPDGRCIVCLRETMALRRSRVARLGLAVMIVGGVVGYRVAMASHHAIEAVAHDLRPVPVPMHASLLGEPVPTAENAPSAAVDLTREQRLREFQDAFANAWWEGLAQAATATAETPTGPAGPPIPTASANLPTVTDTPITTTVADLRIASATATPTATPTPPTTAVATADPLMITAALTTIATADLPAAPTITVADAGPQDLHVVIYSASWCPACQQAKAWMTLYGIPFEERDIDATTEYVQQLRLLNRRMSIPTFDIDGNVMVGFNPRRLVLMLQRAVLRRVQGGAL